jgi:hypothetical protein
MHKSLLLLAFLANAASVFAHGHVDKFLVGTKTIQGFNPSQTYAPTPLAVPGWTADILDNGFVGTDAINKPDIICHKNAKPGKTSIPIAAGDTITMIWDAWPQKHPGPVLNYIAECPGDCSTVDKAQLKFVKLTEDGLVNGQFADQKILAATNPKLSWPLKLPSSLKAGNYVLRHEIIALHGASTTGGAQFYPNCVNLQISGNGTLALSGGIPATSFYKAGDPGIFLSISIMPTSYTIPGPPVWNQTAA